MKMRIVTIDNLQLHPDGVAVTMILAGNSWETAVKMCSNVLQGDKEYMLNVEAEKRGRSLNANAYCWVLCDKIGETVGTTKETIYRRAVEAVGVFAVVEVKEEAAARWIANWQARGLGWIAEEIGRKNGFASILNYYGSSVYDSKEMARLIDWLIEEAKELDIETLPPDEIERIKSSWEGG